MIEENIYKIIIEIWDILKSFIGSIIFAVSVLLYTYLRNKITIFSRFGKSIYSIVTRKKYVLFWMDDDIKNSNSLIQCLKNSGMDKYHFRNLILARQFPYYPNSKRFIEGIILISTDVSKLSYDTDSRVKIQKHILSFVEKGGVLIGAHDIIYRRVRNELFESAFGCKLTDFKRFKSPIQYKINNELNNHPLLDGLPTSFYLLDSEVCWGTWASDSLILATCKIDNNTKPLITTRNYGNGAIIWLNSGDKQTEQCKSISIPDEKLLLIIKNAILNKDDIIQYNKNIYSRYSTSQIRQDWSENEITMQSIEMSITAHRGGGRAKFPENSISAIKNTIEEGKADRIEVDIHQTKDNVLIVIHDKSIDRTTTGKGMIKNMSYQELRKFHLKSSCTKEKIPLLEDVIKIIDGKCKLVIELKYGHSFYPNIEKRTVEMIKKHNAENWCIIQSFNDDILQRTRNLDMSLHFHKLLFGKLRFLPIIIDNKIRFRTLESYQFVDEFSVFYLFANREILKISKSMNKKINVWTVNDDKKKKKILKLGVDGIITDFP